MPERIAPSNGPTPTNPGTGAVDPAPANGPQDGTGQPGTVPAPQQPAPAPAADQGFPANTPVAQMTDKQEAAYWRHQSRKHEDRAKSTVSDTELSELRAAAAERDQLKHAQMSDSEKAIAEARAEGEKNARLALAPDLVAAEFRAQSAGRVPGLDALVEDLNHQKFLTAEGRPDTAAISARVQALIPAGAPAGGAPQAQRGPDLEQGHRTAPTNTPSVSGGADLYAKFKKK